MRDFLPFPDSDNNTGDLMYSILQSKTVYFSCAVLCSMLFYKIVAMDMLLYLPVFMVICTIIFFGIKYPLFGLLFAFVSMNSFFNLIPRQLFSGTFINKTWDLGFFLMIIFGASLLIRGYKKMDYLPFYLKVFGIFLIICVISFFLTIIKYQFPLIDAFRTFRYYLGYLFILFFLQYLLYAKDGEKALNKLLEALYIVCFILLAIYNIQFLIQKPLFLGYNRDHTSIYGEVYVRSIPNFIFFCYIFLWFNLSAWLLNKKLLPMGKYYILLCFSATLFTFTRGIYISVFIAFLLTMFLILSSKRYNTTNLIIAFLFGILFLSTMLITGYLKPFIARALTISEDTFHERQESTFWYRIGLVEDRVQLIKNENPLLGLGFVHNKYGYKFGIYRGNYDENIAGPSLGCADIAWGNIIYQTGWLGFASFTFFVFSVIYYVFFKLRKIISTITVDRICLIELAAVVELSRMFFLTMISNMFTMNTEIISIIFVLAGFSYMLQRKKENENINPNPII